ncbi:carbohydrate esterase family 5 protein [Pseudocercospora fijiensis CIRAD86]|uniref:Carbohydrate esterase family 5 protein n=1 Tax=Pseudocercospora fijiensis (strain CIRAD86) TaxID=383855 RepID=M3AN78_PSEFD|nr:carbohydrate esterase family 5 protein [Pseudocercospora fijiensis CIRAD86]EME86061.1 carbohydrate esterase family 5 protein [Pseudocercospora fijiensis CIRAD86]
MVHTLLSLAGLAALVSALPLDPRQTVSCVEGLYILVARGSNEDVGEGSVGSVADAIEARVPNSVSQAIDYPATIIALDSNYFTSVADGIEDTKTKIQDYVDACGSASRIALVGYSQGGNVMTDTLAGGTGKPDPIGEEYAQYSEWMRPWYHIVVLTRAVEAAVVFGDPRFNAGQAYSAGNSTSDGIFARHSSLAALSAYAGILRSYCDEGDPFCASGDDLDVHYATTAKYTEAATDFVVGLTT